MSKAKELREMSDEQVALTLKEAAENLFRLRIRSQTEKIGGTSEKRQHRRLIARLQTIQSERARTRAAGA